MSRGDYWDAAMQRGMKAYDQVDLLQKNEVACWKAADKLPLKDRPPVIESCQRISAEIDYILSNIDAIDKAIPNPRPEPSSKGQEASDAVYGDSYAKGKGMSDAKLRQAIDDIIDQIHASGMTPSLRAKLHGYKDALDNNGFSPPIYDPGARWPPRNKPEEPQT